MELWYFGWVMSLQLEILVKFSFDNLNYLLHAFGEILLEFEPNIVIVIYYLGVIDDS